MLLSDFLPLMTFLIGEVLSGLTMFLFPLDVTAVAEVTSWSLESPDSCLAYVWKTGGGGGHGGPPSDSGRMQT